MSEQPLEGFPLSPQQERLWYLRAGGRLPLARAAALVEVLGPLDPEALRRALETLVARHEILRTSFQRLQGMTQPLQVPEARGRVELSLQAGPGPEPDPDLPVLRAVLTPLGPLRHELRLDLSPLCIDRAGFLGLAGDLERLYGAAPADGEPLQYADISATLWELLGSEETELGRKHWARQRRHLAGLAPLALPLGADPVSGETAGRRTVAFTLEPSLRGRIDALAAAHRASARAFLLAAWQALLGALGGRRDFLLAVAYDGRMFEGLPEVPGLLARYLPQRCDLRQRLRFVDLMREVEAAIEKVAAHNDYFTWQPALEDPFPPFGFHFLDARRERSNARTLFELRRIEFDLEPLDLEMVCVHLDQETMVELRYASAVFSHFEAGRLAGWLESLLRSAAAAPETALEELALFGEAEAARLHVELNDTRLDLPRDATLPRLFARQAAATPERVAAVSEDLHLTYSGLADRAGRLAARLRGLGVGPETRVGVRIERGMDLVAGLLAVLEAGGAYVPLEPSHPEERLALLVEDSRPLVVLTEGSAPDVEGGGLEAGGLEAAPENLAYVIYTSGSTGRPKGVLVEHRAILNRLLWMRRRLPVLESDRFLFKTPFGFDASIWEILLPLISGARLVIARPEGHRDPDYLTRRIAEQGVTLFQLVPSMLRVWLQEPGLAASCASLRAVFCGGETLAADLVPRFHELLPGADLWNLYGPTECAIDVTSWPCLEGDGPVPVGRPIANTRIHLLDPCLRPVPAGLPGELHVAGAGLARGYLGRPGLTAERFVPDPLAPREEPGGRLYRTGDLARLRPDGAVELLGRVDQQVKVRGVRVEPGEIEAALGSDPAVREAAVVPRQGAAGETVLVAYVVPAEPRDGGWPAVLRAGLEHRLPAAMVPAGFVVLPALPRLPSGKVDRQALPDPETAAPPRALPDAPRTLGETLMAEIWADLLKVEAVGIHDNFFELGGHSLLATQLVSRLRRTFQVDLEIRSLFDAPTIAALVEHIEATGQRGSAVPVPPLQPAARDGSLPLSFAQQRLWFLDQLDPGSAAYNISLAVRLTGRLDRAALAAGFEELVRRHEMLRTVFPALEDLPVQRILPPGQFDLPLVDLADLEPEGRAILAAALARQEARRPFDLARGPLLRTVLVRLGGGDHLLLVLMHHIVSDGWSTAILLHEIGNLYEAAVTGRPSTLPDLPVQYADFAVWQRQWLQGEVLEAQLAWWREQGEPPMVQLPADRPRPAVRSGRGARLPFVLGGALPAGLRVLGRRQGATLFMLLLAAFKALLHRVTGQTDLAVGTPIANRTRMETEGLIGFFVNTLLLRSALRPEEAFTVLLARVREVSLSASRYQDLPFEKLVEELRPERSASQTPLFNVLFVLQNVELAPARLPGLLLEPWPIENGTAKFDLTLDLTETPEGIAGAVELNTDLFDPATVARLMGHFENLLEAVAADPGRSLESLPLLSPAERQQLVEWNDTAAEVSGGRVDALFAAQAARTPDAVALRFDGGCVTYCELDRRSDRLARRLLAAGIGPEARVGLLAERSPGMVAGVLAILKAGGAFLPLDPGLPEERLAQLIADSGAWALFASSRLLDGRPSPHPRTFLLEGEEDPGDPGGYSIAEYGPDSLAYVMYTSGSTGAPKGVMVPHRGLAGYLRWAVEAYGLGEGSGAPLLSPLAFDLTLTSLLAPLIAGGFVSLLPQSLEPGDLGRVLRGGGFDLVKVTPAHLELLRDEGAAGVLIVGGEALHGEDLRSWRARAPGSRIFNEYGPTETVVGCCVHEVPAGEPPPGPIPIGRPIANASLHLLDPAGLPVPLGVPGELYIGGAGVARGYLGRPDRTAERFVPDPFGPAGARLYRTGDLARRAADGRLVFLGRIDHQVKVRGVRIELGEVEAVLLQHPQVREAAVLAQGDSPGNRRLVAYVAASEELDTAELRAFLRGKLPDLFVPSGFVTLPALPLTPNGKVDRAVLRQVSPERERQTVAPRNDVEAVLAGIWRQVLGIESVGVRDDFFELGGHSLLATQVLSRIRKTFRTELPLRGFYAAATVESLAEALVAVEPKPGQTQRVARLLVSVSHLDEDEARRLLEQKRQTRPAG